MPSSGTHPSQSSPTSRSRPSFSDQPRYWRPCALTFLLVAPLLRLALMIPKRLSHRTPQPQEAERDVCIHPERRHRPRVLQTVCCLVLRPPQMVRVAEHQRMRTSQMVTDSYRCLLLRAASSVRRAASAVASFARRAAAPVRSSAASCPHAAAISWPRVSRTVQVTPRAMTRF